MAGYSDTAWHQITRKGGPEAARPFPEREVVRGFLEGWKPFAECFSGYVAQGVLDMLEAETPEARRRLFRRFNLLYRLHEVYRELGVFRSEQNEKAEAFSRLFSLSTAGFAQAIRGGDPRPYTAVLQAGFEFGRKAVSARHQAVRGFLLDLFRMEVAGPGMKYSLYPNGVLYSGGGKTHEEMVREFSQRGLGGGTPLVGGLVVRLAPRVFSYDASSTAYRSTGNLNLVQDGLRRWIHITGGQEDRIRIVADPARLE